MFSVRASIHAPIKTLVTKRANRTVIEMARSLLLESKLSDHFWSDAFQTAKHITYLLYLYLINYRK